MKVYEIKKGTSFEAVSEFISFLQLMGGSRRVRSVILNTEEYPKDEESENWPCIFQCDLTGLVREGCESEIEIRIRELDSGFSGIGPRDLLFCLKAAGFGEIARERIFNERFSKEVVTKH